MSIKPQTWNGINGNNLKSSTKKSSKQLFKDSMYKFNSTENPKKLSF